MYRIYDTKRKCWINNNVYLTPDDKIFTFNKSIFGFVRMQEKDECVCHQAINLQDKDNKEIFEGDFLEAEVSENKIIYGLVVYAKELSSYIILCDESNEYFVLGTDILEHIKIVGNVFDGYSKYEQKQKNKQTL